VRYFAAVKLSIVNGQNELARDQHLLQGHGTHSFRPSGLIDCTVQGFVGTKIILEEIERLSFHKEYKIYHYGP